MCGRYVTVSSPEQLAERFGVDDVTVPTLEPRWNVAPSLQVPAVLQRDGRRALGTLRWGLVPAWAKDLRKGPRPINARVETVHEKRMFTRSFEQRRCILPADGFYEWQVQEGSDRKQPWYIHDPDDLPLPFAGIWRTWRDPGTDEAVHSCAILTTEACGLMRDLHHRMPVVLPPTLWDTWLDATPQGAPHLQEVLAAVAPPALRAHEVSDRVNNVRNHGPELLTPGTVD
jgi:putative SOS response-associated peptidase YedK